jgi:hypothetical protein
MVDILFQNTTIYHMNIDSNAFEMIELYSWIHNLEKCLINGTIPKKYLPSISMPIMKYTSSK